MIEFCGAEREAVGSFTMFEMPTGSYDKGLGVGKVWYKLPVWLQKTSGTGFSMVALAIRSFLKGATVTSPTGDSC
jgi:hypothetical protein